MTKRVLTLVPALLLSLLINAQNLIIPRPVTEKAGEGHFVLNEKTSITSNEKNSFNLKYLKGKIEAASGFKLAEASSSV